MKKSIVIVLVAGCTLTLASCNNNDEDLRMEPNELRFSSGLDVINTRGANVQNEQFLAGQYFDAFVFDAGTTNQKTYGTAGRLFTYTTDAEGSTMFVDGAASTTEKKEFWPSNGSGVNIYAWYPQGAVTDVNATTAPTFTVAADQNTDIKASDLMYGIPAANPVARQLLPVPLTFKHLLTKINIVLVPGESMKKSNGDPDYDALAEATVELVNIKTGCTITTLKPTASTESAITVGDTKGTVSVMKVAEKPAEGSLTAAAMSADASAIVMPQELNPATITDLAEKAKIRVTLKDFDHPLTYVLKSNTTAGADATDWEPSKQYTYTVTVELSELRVSASIQGWGDELPRSGTATME